jgi:hypothetical protein
MDAAFARVDADIRELRGEIKWLIYGLVPIGASSVGTFIHSLISWFADVSGGAGQCTNRIDSGSRCLSSRSTNVLSLTGARWALFPATTSTARTPSGAIPTTTRRFVSPPVVAVGRLAINRPSRNRWRLRVQTNAEVPSSSACSKHRPSPALGTAHTSRFARGRCWAPPQSRFPIELYSATNRCGANSGRLKRRLKRASSPEWCAPLGDLVLNEVLAGGGDSAPQPRAVVLSNRSSATLAPKRQLRSSIAIRLISCGR